MEALAEVEDQVPAVAGGQAGCQLAGVANALDGKAQAGQRAGYGVDGLRLVELGGIDVAITRGEILAAEVIGQADSHPAASVWGSG